MHCSRGVVPGGAGGAMAPPYFGRLVDPISIRGTETNWHPRIFRLTHALVQCNGQNKKFQGVYHNTKAISNGDLKWKRVENQR